MATVPGIAVAAADTASGTHTAATITYALASGVSHVISGIAWSYGSTPTGGNLSITDGSTVVWSMDITSAGAGFIPFQPPKMGTAGSQMLVTLADGGAACAGKVSVAAHWQYPA